MSQVPLADASLSSAGRELLLPSEALRRGFEFAVVGVEADAAPASVRPAGSRTGTQTAPARPAATEMQARQGFCIGSLNLMIRYEDGSELTEMPAVHRLPNTPPWFAGMANLHGSLVPVFDLAQHLGVEHTPHARPLLLVLAHGADAAGIVIDGLPQRLRFGADESIGSDTVPEALSAFVPRAALIGPRLWFDLDTHALLAALEKSLVAMH